ncbi:MAG: hypothetical protein ACE5GE_05345, partial [Phycisphaerae bacterium]
VSGQPFEVFEATAGPSLETEIEPNDDKSRYTIKIRIAEDAVDGSLGTLVNIRTNSPLQPIVHVPVFAFVAPRVKIDPPIVLLGTKTGDASLHRAVFLKNPALENFAILDVSVDKDYVEAKVVDRPDAPTGFRYLDIALTQTARPDQARATVTIKTDLPGAETLSLPVLIGRADQDIGDGGSEK